MQSNDKNYGYSEAQINAMKKELFEDPQRKLHAFESNPSAQHGQALIQLMLDGVAPQADQASMSASTQQPPQLKNYGGQMLEDWMDIDVSKMGLGQHPAPTANAVPSAPVKAGSNAQVGMDATNPLGDIWWYNQFVNPATRNFNNQQPHDYIGERDQYLNDYQALNHG